jgi:hypothetical protein
VTAPDDAIPPDDASPEAAASSQAGWTGRLAVLDGLPDRPLPEHAEVYQSLHADLQAALAEIDGA